MSKTTLTQPFPWRRYSKKLHARIITPRWGGVFTQEDATDRNVRLVTGFDGQVSGANAVRIYWLVDETDGIIADAKHQTFGQSALIGAAEAACELCVGKNYDQAGRLSADIMDKHLRDNADTPAFPAETSAHLNLVIGAIEAAAAKCTGIPLPETYVTPAPVGEIEVLEGGYPGFLEMPDSRQQALIEQVIAEEVRPYIELDAGGIEVLKVLHGREVLIAYSGTCTTCHAATGSTLSYIQHVLRAKVHPDLIVIPNIEDDASWKKSDTMTASV